MQRHAFKTLRLYYGRFDLGPFFVWLGKQKGNYALSLNGFVGDEDQRVEVPGDQYHEHYQIDNGQSATRRINRLGVVPVTDSLYIRRNRVAPMAGATEVPRRCGT